jgi:hypothetical protein
LTESASIASCSTNGRNAPADRLINFYISIEEGDWSSLYRIPATALLIFIYRLLGKHIISIRFAIRTGLLSLLFTAMMPLLYLTIIYLRAVFHATPDCAAPPLVMALEVPIYLRQVLPQIFIVNAIFDIATWSATVCGLRFISTTRGRYAVLGVIIGIVAFSLLILKLFQAIYFALPVGYGARNISFFLSPQQYMSAFMISLREGIFYLDMPMIIKVLYHAYPTIHYFDYFLNQICSAGGFDTDGAICDDVLIGCRCLFD